MTSLRYFSFYLLLLSAPALAQEQFPDPRRGSAEDRETVTALAAAPRSLPSPWLKYQLMPPLVDRKPGNAAVLYNKVGLLFTGKAAEEVAEKLVNWCEIPAAELPLQQLRETVNAWHSSIEHLDMAARRTQCDWQLPFGEQNMFMILLPELQAARGYARLLVVQARLQIAEGRYDDAVHTLQTGFGMAEHLAQGPTLINALVAASICHLLTRPIQDLIERPDGPNLYWALQTLPRPMLDIRRAIEAEMSVVYLSYPGIDRTESGVQTKEEAEKSLQNLIELYTLGDTQARKTERKLTAIGLALRGYGPAKKRLLESGMSREKVESMPVAQVLTLDALQTYKVLRDRMFAWTYLPYAEARPFIAKEQQYLASEGRRQELVPLASLLLPALNSAYQSLTRVDRQYAALCNLEAVRLYAATHDGKAPQSLNEIDDVVVSTDPFTGKPFEYRVTGGKVRLTGPGTDGVDKSLVYELTLQSNQKDGK
jgi:hypothetical protein